MRKSRIIRFLTSPYHCLAVIALFRAGVTDACAREGAGRSRETDSIPGSVHLNIGDDPEYNRQLDTAITYQQKADSLYHLSVAWRKEAGRMEDLLERGRLQAKITAAEDSMQVYRDLADRHFARLHRLENPYIIQDTVLNGIRVYRYNLSTVHMAEPGESGGREGFGIPETRPDRREDTAFGILKIPAYGPDRAFEHNFILPEGIFYRIQIAVFSRDIPAGHFGGLFPITTEKIAGRDMTRYFVGKFTHLDRARDALQKVRAAGYSDAFIIGYYDGVPGTPEKLQSLEKE